MKACVIPCNVFYADDPQLAREYFAGEIDCVLTNEHLNIYNSVEDLLTKNNEKTAIS